MTEMYWITRLEAINGVLFAIELISGLVLAICVIWMILSYDDNDKVFNKSKRAFKKIITPFFVTTLLLVFIPTKKDMLMIYGIGGTIDYIKSNDTAKSMPNKCIEALDKLLDEYVDEENNNKNK